MSSWPGFVNSSAEIKDQSASVGIDASLNYLVLVLTSPMTRRDKEQLAQETHDISSGNLT